jgi:hypothetical protein
VSPLPVAEIRESWRALMGDDRGQQPAARWSPRSLRPPPLPGPRIRPARRRTLTYLSLNPLPPSSRPGRIGIVGGSADYSGAPFFASMASLRAGADLAHVFCTPDAGQVIKTYSPDLIVHTVFRPPPSSPSSSSKAQEDDGLPSEEELEKLLGRLHALVIGPGLGRDDFMQAAGKRALKVARKLGLWVVLDAECVSSVSLPLPVWFSRAPRADFRLPSREPCFPNLTCSSKARN